MRIQVEIISVSNYLVRILFEAPNLVRTSYFSGNLQEEKVLEFRQNLFFLLHKSF